MGESADWWALQRLGFFTNRESTGGRPGDEWADQCCGSRGLGIFDGWTRVSGAPGGVLVAALMPVNPHSCVLWKSALKSSILAWALASYAASRSEGDDGSSEMRPWSVPSSNLF